MYPVQPRHIRPLGLGRCRVHCMRSRLCNRSTRIAAVQFVRLWFVPAIDWAGFLRFVPSDEERCEQGVNVIVRLCDGQHGDFYVWERLNRAARWRGGGRRCLYGSQRHRKQEK